MQNLVRSDMETPRQHRTKAELRLKQALAERERFLREHPHMRAYQAEIDKVLDKSGGHQGRLMVLGMLMQGKILEIQREMVKLNRFVQEMK